MIRDKVIGSMSSMSASSICRSPGRRVSRNSTFHCARVTPMPTARRSNALRSACAVSPISKGRVSIGNRYSKPAYIKQRLNCCSRSCQRTFSCCRRCGHCYLARQPTGGMPMQFAWIGFLKSGEAIDQGLQQQISGFLATALHPDQLGRRPARTKPATAPATGHFRSRQPRRRRSAGPRRARSATPGSTANITCSNIRTKWAEVSISSSRP